MRTSLGFMAVADRSADLANAMAFARLAGSLMTDGTMSESKNSILYLGHELDVKSAQSDLVTLGQSVYNVPFCGRTFAVTLPLPLVRAFFSIGIYPGKRTGKVTTIPDIFTSAACPIAVVREFLGGLFGGDGCTPHYKYQAKTFSSVGFIASKTGNAVREQVREFENSLSPMLERCGIPANTISWAIRTAFPCSLTEKGREETKKLKEAGEQLSFCIGADQDLELNTTYVIQMQSTTEGILPFARGVGFRYCSHKSMRLTAAAAWHRAWERVKDDRRFLRTHVANQRSLTTKKISFPKAVRAAKIGVGNVRILHKTTLDWKPIELKVFARDPNPPLTAFNSLTSFGTSIFFSEQRQQIYSSTKRLTEIEIELQEDDTEDKEEQVARVPDKVRYAVPRTRTTQPMFHVKLIAVRDVGERQTFDLTVPTPPGVEPSFTANGIVVHNCSDCLTGWGKKTCPTCRAPFEWHQITQATFAKKPEEIAAEEAARAELEAAELAAGGGVAPEVAVVGGPAPAGAPLPEAAARVVAVGDRVLDLSIFNKPGQEFFGQKLVRLVEELAEMKRANPKAKALVFTQFVPTFVNVKKALAHLGIPFASLEGSMTLRQRENALKLFLGNDKIEVFVLSMRAGGVGLTLTAASHVFMMDPCLNPAMAKQAEDRVHRLGQKNQVFIKHMIASGTIEGTIHKICQEKLSGGVQAGAAPVAPQVAGIEAVALESNELERLFADIEPDADVIMRD